MGAAATFVAAASKELALSFASNPPATPTPSHEEDDASNGEGGDRGSGAADEDPSITAKRTQFNVVRWLLLCDYPHLLLALLMKL